jgi:hypothetical protein
VRIPWFLAVLAGCSFELRVSGDGGTTNGDAPDADDAVPTVDAPDGDIAHVPAAVEDAFDATAPLAIVNAVLDTQTGTTAPTIDVPLPPGTSLTYSVQDGGGPDLAILMVGSLTVSGTLRVRGDRALVIIANTDMIIAGTIDASAEGGIQGAGGYAMGPGRGGNGVGDAASYDDSGGGGGGFGGIGAAGQKSGPAMPGTAGPTYGTAALVRLEGGSGGGAMAPACAGNPPGAGGGAIQLHARGTITLNGVVVANGGGGSGGLVCNGLGTSGAGGGAGGAIYVEASALTGAGRMLAQGGGGGGASNFNNNAIGGDGQSSGLAVQGGPGGIGAGTGVAGETNHGGIGGFRNGGPSALTALSGQNYGNGGGGGGGVGRIVIRATTISGVQTSPQAVQNP